MLSPANDLNIPIRCRGLFTCRTVLVPNPTPLAAVDEREVGRVDGVGDLRQCGVSGIEIGGRVTTILNMGQCIGIPQRAEVLPCISELGLDIRPVNPRDQEQRIRHPSAMADSAPSLVAWLECTDLESRE